MNRTMSAVAEQNEMMWDFVDDAADVLLGDLDTEIASTPYEVVYRQDRVKVKYYRSEAKTKMKTPLLITYALINRETMLDLQPGRSVVQTFLDSGMDIYMIDWGYPTRKDRFMGIDDHVNGYMDDVVDFIREREQIDKINLMGICMGGTFCVMYSALHPEKIKNLVTTVAPTSFDTDQGLLHSWMRSVNVDRMMDTLGNMPGDLMNFGFLLLNPARLMIDKYLSFMENMNSKDFVENFVRMEKWIFDSPDVPGETFREFVKECYQENKLIRNQLVLGGRTVDLKNVTMPLLNIYGQYDHLVPPAACEQLTKAVGGSDVEDVCINTGHIGIYVSSKCQKEFAPRISQWLKDRDGDAAAPQPVKTTGRSSKKSLKNKKNPDTIVKRAAGDDETAITSRREKEQV
ncbi:class III poly(R)-hydroxyalkanoic acid synthase subunit PhaC [Desulfatiferula olefinivorans]